MHEGVKLIVIYPNLEERFRVKVRSFGLIFQNKKQMKKAKNPFFFFFFNSPFAC